MWSEQAKLIGDGAIGAAQQGGAVSLSGDGNTALIGGYLDNSKTGAAWVFTRNGAAWTQSRKLVGTGATGNADQGYSVALSADGTTAAIGGPTDNALAGATWVWTRDGTNWTQAAKLRGVGAIGNAQQGSSVAISLDGSRIIVGALADNKYAGAAWVFVRSSAGVWTEGPSKLIGSGTAGNAEQGAATALSADGSTAIVGGYFDNGELGAAWGTLCLGDNRFAVSAEWQTSDGKSGQGQGVQLTSDTGYFTFFSASNVEVVVKVLNACGLNSKYWVFAGGLTNVNVVLTVRDTVTGSTKIYTNPQGTPYQPIQDTDAFATCSAHGSSLTTSLQAPLPAIAVQPTPEPRPVATCTQNATTLCLSNGRFAVTSTWQTDDGKSGTGQAFPITADTGTFSFFSANNVEVIVKVLDACSTNAGRWVFAGGLTNVHVVLTVRDTATGSVKTYTNPLDTPFQPIQDTSAFGCN